MGHLISTSTGINVNSWIAGPSILKVAPSGGAPVFLLGATFWSASFWCVR
jgi:hypothetical protein